MMKGINLLPRTLYLVSPSVRFEGEMKSFTDKQKLKEVNMTKLALKEMLKEFL